MNILIIDNGTIHLHKLTQLVCEETYTVMPCDAVTFENAKAYDLLILSGSSSFPLTGHAERYMHETSVLKKYTGSVLGICLGCELIVSAFGGALERMSTKDHGIRTASITHTDPICKGFTSLTVYEAHRWRIARLSSQISELARSELGTEIIKHKDKPIYGFQFHPELYAALTDGRKLFENFMDIARKFSA